MLCWHRQPVVLQREHASLDRFADICHGALPAIPLGDAARKARAFRHPKAVFAGINKNLSHFGIVTDCSQGSILISRGDEVRLGTESGFERPGSRVTGSRDISLRPAYCPGMPMQRYSSLLPEGTSYKTRYIKSVGRTDLPDGRYRFVEFYCDAPGCNCCRVIVQVWDEGDNILAGISYGWESPEFYARWSGDGDMAAAREMASATLGLFLPQSKYAEVLLGEFEKVIAEPEYMELLRSHYAEARSGVQRSLVWRKRPKARPLRPAKAKSATLALKVPRKEDANGPQG